jgi:hypothetical protein
MPDDTPDELVPDPTVWRELGVTRMTGHRWDDDPKLAALGWPAPVRINGRKFRFRSQLEAFKANLLRQAIAERGKRHTEAAA